MSIALNGARYMTTGSAVSGIPAKGAMSIAASIMMMIVVIGITMVSIVRRQNEILR